MAKKPKQSFIPGTEPKRFKDLDEAAEEYREGRDERMEATTVEVERKNKLIELMKKHKLVQYDIPGTDPPEEVVLVVEKEGVKLRKKKLPKATGPDSGDEDEGFDDED